MSDLYSAKNDAGQQLKPGGKKWFSARTLSWLRKRPEGVDEKTLKRRPGPLRSRALSEAKKLVGILERGGNNRGPEVDRIIRANGGVPGEPWCGDFVAYVYKRAGSKATQRSWAAVRFLGRVTGTKFLPGPRSGQPGDIVVYDFPGGSPEDHTGILVRYENAAGNRVDARRATHIRAIEGNTGTGGAVSDSSGGGDGVHRRHRPISQVKHVVRVRDVRVRR